MAEGIFNGGDLILIQCTAKYTNSLIFRNHGKGNKRNFVHVLPCFSSRRLTVGHQWTSEERDGVKVFSCKYSYIGQK